MGSLAVVAPLYGRRAHENEDRIAESLLAQTRFPDEIWLIGERTDAHEIIARLIAAERGYDDASLVRAVTLDTPRNEDGTYAVVPYSLKQNYALDRSQADYVTYLTDDSWPAPEKYAAMSRYLDSHPEVGAVYCTQDYGGVTRVADLLMADAHCKVDHTQVMHRRTADRWPEEIEHLTLGDAVFWRRLHESLGPFYPLGPDVMDYVQQTADGISAGQRA